MRRTQGMRWLLVVVMVLAMSLGAVSAQDDVVRVVVATPWLAQPGTQIMVESFESFARTNGWDVEVIDTNEDIPSLVSALEDVSLRSDVDAVVINVDPTQIGQGLSALGDAGIPVFGMDSGNDPLVIANVTSNGYGMAAETASYVVDRLEGEGNVVMFIFEPYPPVQKRGAIAQAIFDNTPDITVIDAITPSFDQGPLAGARDAMEAVLEANPEPGSINAVWAAWDDPALGALQAIEAAGRDGEGIVIVGIDGTEQALQAIAGGGNFEATMQQNFAGIAEQAVALVEMQLAGEEITQSVYYAQARLVTVENAND